MNHIDENQTDTVDAPEVHPESFSTEGKSPQEILAMIRAKNGGGTSRDLPETKVTIVSADKPVFQTLFDQPSTALLAFELYQQAGALRSIADKEYEKYVIGGRNALKLTLEKAYGLYFTVSQDLDCKKRVIGLVKNALPKNQVRENSKGVALFLRYVFRNLDDKQIHVYGRALDSAIDKGVTPELFIKWVEAHKGGWEGVRAAAVAAEKGKNVLPPEEAGLNAVRMSPEYAVIPIKGWSADEKCRVMVALPHDDGTASLIDCEFMIDHIEQVLALYGRNVAAAAKPKAKPRLVLTAGQKRVKAQLVNDLAFNQSQKDEVYFDIARAEEASDTVAADAGNARLRELFLEDADLTRQLKKLS